MNALIRKATAADLPTLVEIEKGCFPSPSWSEKDFAAGDCYVAEVEGQVAGFLVSKQIFPGDADTPPEREILNLAVSPMFRRLGIASALLRNELVRPNLYFLEVRESNVAAQTLYKRFGFAEITRRPAYYSSPVETAIVMAMKWC